jgi:hypothetical protein
MCKMFLLHLEENAYAWHFFEIPTIEYTWLKLSFMYFCFSYKVQVFLVARNSHSAILKIYIFKRIRYLLH